MFGNSQNKRTFASQNETRVFQTNGGFVYRLGRMPLTHQRAVRFCYPLRKEISMRSLFFIHPPHKHTTSSFNSRRIEQSICESYDSDFTYRHPQASQAKQTCEIYPKESFDQIYKPFNKSLGRSDVNDQLHRRRTLFRRTHLAVSSVSDYDA